MGEWVTLDDGQRVLEPSQKERLLAASPCAVCGRPIGEGAGWIEDVPGVGLVRQMFHRHPDGAPSPMLARYSQLTKYPDSLEELRHVAALLDADEDDRRDDDGSPTEVEPEPQPVAPPPRPVAGMNRLQRFAIHHARKRRQTDLTPLRAEIANAIAAVGWRQARPVVERVLGLEDLRERGWWWQRVGKRNGARLLVELHRLAQGTRQLDLFEHLGADEADEEPAS